MNSKTSFTKVEGLLEFTFLALERDALPREVWSGLDPAGDLFDQLAPCFETVFDRACWQVRRRDGRWVELALDIGEVRAGGRRERLCELEFELRAGPPGALFRLARELSGAVPMLPLDTSKSARGFALPQGPLPRIAAPVTLADGMLPADAARAVLRETSAQFTGNLALLLHHRDAELVHQARVGWRRMRSAARLFGAAAQNPLHDPFRWVALSGDPDDIRKTDAKMKELFPHDAHLNRWLDMAGERIAFQGLPARIC